MLFMAYKALCSITLLIGNIKGDSVYNRWPFHFIAEAFENNLEEFTLNMDKLIDSGLFIWVKDGIGSLQHLPNLRKLNLPQFAFFWGPMADERPWDEDPFFVDKLPPRLQSLTLSSCTPPIIKQVRHCYTHRSEQLAHLKEFTILGRTGTTFDSDAEEALIDLQTAFLDIGVDFQYRLPELKPMPHRNWSLR